MKSEWEREERVTGSTVRKLSMVPGEDRKALTTDSGSEAGKEKHS